MKSEGTLIKMEEEEWHSASLKECLLTGSYLVFIVTCFLILQKMPVLIVLDDSSYGSLLIIYHSNLCIDIGSSISVLFYAVHHIPMF